MSEKKTNLAWIDLEMTGLEDDHVIIEIASLVTNSNFVELAEGPVIAIHRTPDEIAILTRGLRSSIPSRDC